MYFILSVLKDMRQLSLCFTNRKSAASFSTLVNIYEDDSGAGNGYSAYWPDYGNEKISLRLWKPRRSVSEIDPELVRSMLHSIYLSRNVDIPDDLSERISIGTEGQGILFSMNALPPRMQPAVGDMYRIPRSLSKDGMGGEGKVIDERRDSLVVIPSHYWEKDGFRNDVTTSEIPKKSAIVIHDWLKDHYPDRKSWEFDQTATD